MKRKVCKGCDTQFVALRADAVTCSPRCRQRYKRMCDKITAQVEGAYPRCPDCGARRDPAWPRLCTPCARKRAESVKGEQLGDGAPNV